MNSFAHARFRIGQPITHKLFGYRGVIVDVDAEFCGSDERLEAMHRGSAPPHDTPWYHVLVHGQVHMTYVTEQNLEVDESGEAIDHPDLEVFFEGVRNGIYVPRHACN